MAGFDQLESSTRTGKPIQLFRFTAINTSIPDLCYTDAEESITFEAQRFNPIPIKRNGIQDNVGLDRSALEVNLVSSAEIVGRFTHYPPSYVVGLTIFKGHAGDRSREFVRVWSGRVLNCEIGEGIEAKLSCEPIFTSLQRVGLRRNFQHQCPHVLYGPICQAEKIAFELTVAELPGGSIIVGTPSEAFGHTIDEFLGGTIEWTTGGTPEIRNILSGAMSDTDFVLGISGPVSSLAVGQDFSIFLGCDHVMTICEERFNNIVNFGGFPWIPSENPINKVSTFF